ncbi:MAG TPA: type I methionyl aminopeptidase [Planctomycetaceae bacterium]|nr:type I methionyl aminopeptidase [Planctomycetaceae bacterium]
MAARQKIPLYLSESERDGLRAAGKFNAQLMDFVRPHVREGNTTEAIDKLVHEYTLDHGHTPACLGYHGFPKSCCISLNQVVCHGIPDNTVLKAGDIVNVDLTTIVDGWYGDQSETFAIGAISDTARRLIQVTFDSLWKGIHAAKPGGTVYEIGEAIFNLASEAGFSIVEQYQGHGIGREFHQDPGVPHFPHPKSRWDVLKPGTCFTIEPMLNLGTRDTVLDRRDGWTVRTRDAKLSAQFEHTILMTEEGPEITTLTQNGPQEGHQF